MKAKLFYYISWVWYCPNCEKKWTIIGMAHKYTGKIKKCIDTVYCSNCKMYFELNKEEEDVNNRLQ